MAYACRLGAVQIDKAARYVSPAHQSKAKDKETVTCTRSRLFTVIPSAAKGTERKSRRRVGYVCYPPEALLGRPATHPPKTRVRYDCAPHPQPSPRQNKKTPF